MELLSLDNKNFISTNTTDVTDLNENKVSIEKQENGNFKLFYDRKLLQVTIKATQGVITCGPWRNKSLQKISEVTN